MFNLLRLRGYTVALALLGLSICLIVIGFGFAPRLQLAANFSAPSTDRAEAPKTSVTPTPTPEILILWSVPTIRLKTASMQNSY